MNSSNNADLRVGEQLRFEVSRPVPHLIKIAERKKVEEKTHSAEYTAEGKEGGKAA